MENKLYFKGRTYNYWIDFKEWKRVKVWNDYKNLMIWNLRPLRKYTEKEVNDFNKWYKENYPENYELLNLEEDGKNS